MICSQCGQEIVNGNCRCGTCGTPTPPASPPDLSFDLNLAPQSSDSLTFDLSITAPAPVAATPKPSARKRKGLIGLLTAFGVILWKFKAFKWLVLALPKLKSLFVIAKFSKILTTTISMLLSIGVYAMMWGWKFAMGFVMLIFIHEMGHVLVLWRKGIKATAPVFIPMMGAFIALKQRPRNALECAETAYGGPALGTVAALGSWALYGATGNPLFLALASVGFWINLFNLIPFPPLDGGWIMGAISPKLWLIGIVLIFVRFLQTHNGFLLFIVLLSFLHIKSIWRNAWHPDPEYYKVSPQARALVTALYVGLALFLGWAHSHTHDLLTRLISGERSP